MMLRNTVLIILLTFSTGLLAEEVAKRLPSADGAKVGFSNLEDGAVVPTEFTVVFSIAGMGIAPAGVEIENTGHHHLLIDVAQLPDFDQPLPASENIIHFGKGQSETQLELSEGQHTLQLVLADYRHLPHDPPVLSERITVTVSSDAPAPGEEQPEE
jgi:hypothetical protein